MLRPAKLLSMFGREPAIEFTTTGSSVSSILTLDTGGTARWQWADGTTSDSATPTKNYGSAASRRNRLIVSPWPALIALDLGYAADDATGPDVISTDYLLPAQNVTAISGLQLATELEILCLANCPELATLNLRGLAALRVLEAFDCESLESFDARGCTSARRLCLENHNLTGLDLTDCVGLRDLRGAQSAAPAPTRGFRTITLPPGGLPNLWHWCVHDNPFTEQMRFDLLGALSQNWIWSARQSGVPAIPPNTIASWEASGNNWSQAGVDALLVAIDGYGTSGGGINIAGSARPSAGVIATNVASLESRGWTITLTAA